MKRIISCVVLAVLAAWAAAWAAAPVAAVVPAQSVEAAVAAGPHANQIILTPVADTYVAKGYDEPNPSGNLKVGYRNEADYITLVRFELPRTVMGTGATITSAELRFFCHESDVELGNSSDLDIAVASRDWDEKTVTYKTKPNETGPKASWAIDECTSKWVNTKDSEGTAETLAEVVQTWYDDEDKNYGWTIGPKNLRTESMFTFQSREGQEGQPMPLSLAPKLYFTYESGVTATFTPSSTPTVTDTPTPTNTPTPTDTPTPTNTPTPSDTATPTNTPTNTPTPSNTPEATLTPTPAKLYMPIVLREFDLFAPVPEMALGDQGPMTGDPAAVAAGSDWRDIARVFFGTRRR